ncbi:MAG: hypothetical protein H7338_22870 [Candidatus Sericytochromatia bacterium]|nr:hypothetical protein [Candidatus Sericytochromatia bacterium]
MQAMITLIETEPVREALESASPLIRRFAVTSGESGFADFADKIDLVLVQAPPLGPRNSLTARALEVLLDDLRMAAVTILKAAVGVYTPEEADRLIAETTIGKMNRKDDESDWYDTGDCPAAPE